VVKTEHYEGRQTGIYIVYKKIYLEFDLEEFFRYFKIQHEERPKYDENTAPEDKYQKTSSKFYIHLEP